MADDAPRIFTIQEANALVPALEVEFGRLARLRTEISAAVEVLGGPDVAVAVLEDGGEPPPGREPDAERLRGLAAAVASAVERVNAFGCLVKDLEAGLVDFFAMQDDEPVFFCWQFGEPAVAHWHGVDEGFAGRRPIEGLEVEPPEFLN